MKIFYEINWSFFNYCVSGFIYLLKDIEYFNEPQEGNKIY